LDSASWCSVIGQLHGGPRLDDLGLAPRRTTVRYGSVGDNGEWKAAIEEYHWDRLDSALQLAIALGVGVNGAYEGWYRTIEAEAITRQQASKDKLSDWLTLELIPHEVGHGGLGHIQIQEIARDACEDVSRRFGFSGEPKTLITILAAETDAPWAVGRYGYMMDKYPYDKICVPLASTHMAHSFAEVVSHEFAHVLVLNATDGKAPKWLHEGVAMLAERSSDLRLRRAFASGEAAWLSPHALEITHSRNRQGEPDRERTWRAYQQSAWLARYLVSLKGEEGIGQLLKEFANSTIWSEIKMRLTNQSATDEALREIFGFGENELFAKALVWLRTGE